MCDFSACSVVRVCGSECLTSQSVGSLPVASWRRLAQRDTSACLAPGASFSSLHEWLRKAVTSPIARRYCLGRQFRWHWYSPQALKQPGPRRAAGWRAGNGGALRRVRAWRRDRCRRRAPRSPPPLPPRCRARPGAPGGGGCGRGCGAWRGRRTGGRRRSRPQLPIDQIDALASLNEGCDAEPSVDTPLPRQ